MIVCGGLQLDFESAMINVIANAALGRGGPSQLVYQGHGTFGTANGMMGLSIFTNDGVPLDFDPLDPQSYLVGIQVNANAAVNIAAHSHSAWDVVTNTVQAGASGQLDIQFTQPGPGWQLLGLATNGGHLSLNPLDIANAIASHFSIANRIDVQNSQGGTVVHYILQGSPQPLKGLMDGKSVPMQLASIEATHAATGQTIKVTEWTMQFKGDGGKVLDGTIGMDITGGAFPYHVRMTYPHSMDPEVDLSCR